MVFRSVIRATFVAARNRKSDAAIVFRTASKNGEGALTGSAIRRPHQRYDWFER